MGARIQLLTVIERPRDDNSRVDLGEGLGGAQPPGQDAFLACHQLAPHQHVHGDEGAGDVPHRQQVLGQCAGHGLAHGRHRRMYVIH